MPTAGTARYARWAQRFNTRARVSRCGVGTPFYIVIELEAREDHGTFEIEAELAACLAIAGLRPHQVEVRSNMPLTASSLTSVL